MIQLNSRWGIELKKEHILEEYPRPGLVRDSYMNLNGEWEYAISGKKETDAYDGTILVPFSPESMLSGVGKTLKPGQYLHYRKSFQLPDGFIKRRVLLHFGAVDQECDVYLNGHRLGSHEGGYLPFTFDITEYLEEENTITMAVTDHTEFRPHARGKQKLVNNSGMSSLFYTPQSGIWKTVWLESVPEEYISALKITPLFDRKTVKIRTMASDGAKDRKIQIRVLSDGTQIAETEGNTGSDINIPIPDMIPWSPDRPFLYDLEVICGEDQVRSYFGMRKYSVERDSNGILRFYLNNQPFFFNGVLDQGYWPDGLMTAPSDEALIYDIEKLKEYGFNTIRKHIKIEPERFYYHCDRLGMVVWQDMPNGGGNYNMGFVTYLPNALGNFVRGISDHHYRWFKREDKQGRIQYEKDLKGMIRLLYNYPSIAVWVPFNEGWGQFDAGRFSKAVKEWDPTRLVNEACGWFDQGGGDMYSIHNYLRKLKVKPDKNRVVALTEYGGYAFPLEGHLACEKKFGYQKYSTMEELTGNYKRLWDEEIFPNLKNGLSAAIYTQTSDIEEEVNGIMTYDREVDKLSEDVVRELNRSLYEQFYEMTKKQDA